MALIVQKYGGTSVGTPERIMQVAQRVIDTQNQGHQVAVVVSAMAGDTDRLIDLATQITGSPRGREMDVLLATGEQRSIALLSMAIDSLGFEAQSFLGHQVKIHTDNSYMHALILDIEAGKISQALNEGRIAVVAGFQGIDGEDNVTTLGRGGSDTTAVALAAALNADWCDIYTDVDGVFTTDPNICPDARKLDRISYEEMLEMASLGAKVLQTRSVLYAMKYNVPVNVRSSFTDLPGTLVTKEESHMEGAVITGVAYNNDEARVTVQNVPDVPGAAAKLFVPLAEAKINMDMIIQNASREGATDITFTVPKGDLKRTLAEVEAYVKNSEATAFSSDSEVSKVSVIGVGMRSHTGIASTIFQTLAAEGINVQMVSTSEIKVSCLIASKYVELAVRALHAAFKLGDKPPEQK